MKLTRRVLVGAAAAALTLTTLPAAHADTATEWSTATLAYTCGDSGSKIRLLGEITEDDPGSVTVKLNHEAIYHADLPVGELNLTIPLAEPGPFSVNFDFAYSEDRPRYTIGGGHWACPSAEEISEFSAGTTVVEVAAPMCRDLIGKSLFTDIVLPGGIPARLDGSLDNGGTGEWLVFIENTETHTYVPAPGSGWGYSSEGDWEGGDDWDGGAVALTGLRGLTYYFEGNSTWDGWTFDCDLSADPAPSFSDVPDDHTFYDQITWLASTGITTGYEDGTFKPRNQITREAMAAFLYRYAGADYEPPATSPFSDVPTDHAFYREITWLDSTGITTGYDNGTFRPKNKITREAMAAFLFRYTEPEGFSPPAQSTFRDVPESHAFYREIAWLADSGLTTGYKDGTEFRPKNKITREATAAFLYRHHHDDPGGVPGLPSTE